MNKQVLIPKEHSSIPDWYGFKIFYHDGTKDFYEGMIVLDTVRGIYEVLTKDDEWVWIPKDAIRKIELDKAFSKVVAYNQEQKRKRELEQQKREEENETAAKK